MTKLSTLRAGLLLVLVTGSGRRAPRMIRPEQKALAEDSAGEAPMGAMRVARHNCRIGSLLAVALVLAATPLPAAAQSGSEAVVCVGSERRTLATNPIRRVYTEDMELVYRIGVDIGQRDHVERTLGSELGSYPEVWCAWSDPGDDHAVIISYTGVIRQDLTVDPEDPRFQAFSVGFGPDFDAAESQATTINQRFSSRNDGSGYEVLLRETWGVAEGVVAGGAAPESDLPEGRICTGSASSEGLLDGSLRPPWVLLVERGSPRQYDGDVERRVFKRFRPRERPDQLVSEQRVDPDCGDKPAGRDARWPARYATRGWDSWSRGHLR